MLSVTPIGGADGTPGLTPGVTSFCEVLPLMATGNNKGFFRAFLDFFILFSGISTASNLARTQGRPLLTRGLFLFRKPERK